MKNKGLLIVISGPSGAGKGTLCKKYLENSPETFLSISATTRLPREGETDGKDYYFRDESGFLSMIENNELLEWASFCGNYYGTPKSAVEEKLERGDDVILEIDVAGAMQVMEAYPDGLFIFVIPPGRDVLYKRLEGRASESSETIENRVEQSKRELTFVHRYHYLVINDDLDRALIDLQTVIRAEKMRVSRNLRYIEREWGI